MICIITQFYYRVYITIPPFSPLRLKFLVRMSNILNKIKNLLKKVEKNPIIG